MNIKSETRNGSVRVDQNIYDYNVNTSNHTDNNSDDYGDNVVADQTDLGTGSQFPTMSVMIK